MLHCVLNPDKLNLVSILSVSTPTEKQAVYEACVPACCSTSVGHVVLSITGGWLAMQAIVTYSVHHDVQ